jgi:hypothetical protein
MPPPTMAIVYGFKGGGAMVDYRWLDKAVRRDLVTGRTASCHDLSSRELKRLISC